MLMLDWLVGLIAPHVCLQCGTEGSLWCMTCRAAARPALERCYRCQRLMPEGRTCAACRRTSPLIAVRAAVRYGGTAKQLVWKLKFERARAGAGTIGGMLAAIYPATGVLVVPVPTATGRVRRRGYDQAVLIARTFSQQLGLPCSPALRRYGQSQQHTATREQRRTQLQVAFGVARPTTIRGKHILLIDDVLTTGATLEAAAVALKAAGAKRVSALVFAQA